MIDVFIVIILIFLGQMLGSALGLLRRPSDRLLHSSLGYAAAIMISVSVIELLPESLTVAPVWLVAASFLIGIALFEVLDHVLPHIHPEFLKKDHKDVERSVNMLVVGIMLHNIPEGLATGFSFAMDPAMGVLIAFVIALHNIPENLATMVPLYCCRKCRKTSFYIMLFPILAEVAGFAAGYWLLGGSTLVILGASLAMAAGIMIYISLDELVPSAQIRQHPRDGSISFALGVITVLILGMLA